MLGLLILTSCAKTQLKDSPEPIPTWWGTKAEVQKFLDSPNAQAERWLCTSMDGK